MGSMEVTELPERTVPWLADDEVVEHLDLEEATGLDQLAGDLEVGGARVRIA